MSNSPNSSSMFDSLTVSAPALGETELTGTPPPPVGGVSGAGISKPGFTGITQPVISSYAASPSFPATLPPVAPAAAGTSLIGSTRLIARVEPQDFVSVVSGGPAGSIVLQTAQGKSANRGGGDRYVACIGGIVFITNSTSALRLPDHIITVKAAAVLCEGRPLSNDDYM